MYCTEIACAIKQRALINVLCSSAHSNGHPHSPGSYTEIVWTKTADKSYALSEQLKTFISEAKSLILFPLESSI